MDGSVAGDAGSNLAVKFATGVRCRLGGSGALAPPSPHRIGHQQGVKKDETGGRQLEEREKRGRNFGGPQSG